ncbi:DUF2255 family protein [Ktedonospora formicarum]|uniref:DUF2255 family protein n=1 Tax=Ktedonospora formicarum TaxID=2778364 RepID=A0A8J3HRY9_9CHLR|nr:DUF2255 family protein [Ktedonospora formicarum]GHO42186.1 hypothetical protein KSX_03490 [Ktedonospora formicarum]
MKRFTEDQLQHLSHMKTVVIETRLSSHARSHSTPIWVVVEDGDVYIRSYRGQAGRWYQEITAFPSAVLHLNREQLAIRAIRVTDEATITRVSQALLQKYPTSSSSYAESMVRDEVVGTTLRLEPASLSWATDPEERKIPSKSFSPEE